MMLDSCRSEKHFVSLLRLKYHDRLEKGSQETRLKQNKAFGCGSQGSSLMETKFLKIPGNQGDANNLTDCRSSLSREE